MTAASTRHQCYFCNRSRESLDELRDHLEYWHNMSRTDSNRVMRRPWLARDWPEVTLDERYSRLSQLRLIF